MGIDTVCDDSGKKQLGETQVSVGRIQLRPAMPRPVWSSYILVPMLGGDSPLRTACLVETFIGDWLQKKKKKKKKKRKL